MTYWNSRTEAWRKQILEHLRTNAEADAFSLRFLVGDRTTYLGHVLNDMLALAQIIRLRRGVYALHPRLRKETA